MIRWISAAFFGMGLQAAITAWMFPKGTTANQQLLAALLFMMLAIIFALIALVFPEGER